MDDPDGWAAGRGRPGGNFARRWRQGIQVGRVVRGQMSANRTVRRLESLGLKAWRFCSSAGGSPRRRLTNAPVLGRVRHSTPAAGFTAGPTWYDRPVESSSRARGFRVDPFTIGGPGSREAGGPVCSSPGETTSRPRRGSGEPSPAILKTLRKDSCALVCMRGQPLLTSSTATAPRGAFCGHSDPPRRLRPRNRALGFAIAALFAERTSTPRLPPPIGPS